MRRWEINKDSLNYREHIFQDELYVTFERKQKLFNCDKTQQLFPA